MSRYRYLHGGTGSPTGMSACLVVTGLLGRPTFGMHVRGFAGYAGYAGCAMCAMNAICATTCYLPRPKLAWRVPERTRTDARISGPPPQKWGMP
jgi:hypothetical protein